MAHLIIALSYLLGAGSLLGLCTFLIMGSFELVPLGLSGKQALLFDAGLSFLFFVQHSGMIRRSFRRWLATFVSRRYHAAIYSIASGVALSLLLVLWQRVETEVWLASGLIAWAIWGLFAGSILGFWWGFRALGSFDAFGARAVSTGPGEEGAGGTPFTVRGPYRFVRHPLYTAALVMIWASPVLTLDRLLFSVLWTGWVVIGTMLEERDLVTDFGESYREYRRSVPMLLPWPRGMRSRCRRGPSTL